MANMKNSEKKRKLIDQKYRENIKAKLSALSSNDFVKKCDEIREKTYERVKKHRDNRKSLKTDTNSSKRDSTLQAALKKAIKIRQQTGERVRKLRENISR